MNLLKTVRRYGNILSGSFFLKNCPGEYRIEAQGERMKRIYSVLMGIVSILLLTAFMGYSKRNTYYEKEEEHSEGKFFISYDKVNIYPWEKDGVLYFFLPASFNWEQAELIVHNGYLQIDGKNVDFTSEEGYQNYEMNTDYTYHFSWGDVEEEGTLLFMKSANIGTVYIETDSGSMEWIDQDKEYQEGGWILITDCAGNVCHAGLLDSMKSRGNTTWQSEKKSYKIKLSREADLFQMEEGKNWILLSNVYDGNKLQNKISLEMASDWGLSYTSEGEWVDLYLNGQYRGNYLLCEKIENHENRVGIMDLEQQTRILNGDLKNLETFDTGTRKGILAERNPEDISGGYILEKDLNYDSVSGFLTKENNPFSIQAPQYATKEQVDYIADYIQQIEDMIATGDERLFDYVDLDSFVLRYLLEEVILNRDFGINSMYFYKEQGDQKLYAGPIWDYDGAYGQGLSNSKILAAREIQNYLRERTITWYPGLYENDIFYDQIVEVYVETVRPYILELIQENGKIDNYANLLRSSVEMDMTRWPYSDYRAGYYENFESNVRYMKYFLARRLRFLDQEWLGEDNHYEAEGNGEWYTATFIGKTKTESFEVQDAEEILATPEYLLGEHEWWYNIRDDRPFVAELPVYEDVTYYAHNGE